MKELTLKVPMKTVLQLPNENQRTEFAKVGIIQLKKSKWKILAKFQEVHILK